MEVIKKTKYQKHGKGQHQWDTQPSGRRKCLKCGRIQRLNNTSENRMAREVARKRKLARRF